MNLKNNKAEEINILRNFNYPLWILSLAHQHNKSEQNDIKSKLELFQDLNSLIKNIIFFIKEHISKKAILCCKIFLKLIIKTIT